jgi:hypothetical protein
MQLYGIIYTLILLKREREEKRRERGCREKGKKKEKGEKRKVEGKREKLYLFNK